MTTQTYEFRVDGRLTDQAREAFCDMRIEEFPAGATLCGTVIDESHLLGIMAQCRTLGLVVISAHPVASDQPDPRWADKLAPSSPGAPERPADDGSRRPAP